MIDRTKCKISSLKILNSSISNYFSSKSNNLRATIEEEKNKYCSLIPKEDVADIEKELKIILSDISVKRICKDNNLYYDRKKLIKSEYSSWFKIIDNGIQIKQFMDIIIGNLAVNLYYNNFIGFTRNNDPIIKGSTIYSEELDKNVIVISKVNKDFILVTESFENKKIHTILLDFVYIKQ